MKKVLLASAVLAALAAPATVIAQATGTGAAGGAGAGAAPAATPEHTLTGNVGLFSDYRFRGISQTFKQPAIQGGFD
jgi:uncharacterized protein (TIGR02001 family)